MAKKTAPLLPSSDELLTQFGDRLRVARLRRRLAARQVAERAGMSAMTLRSIERGGSGVTIGAWLAVMQVLGVEKDLNLLAMTDAVGRELQDSRLPARTRKAGAQIVVMSIGAAPQPGLAPANGTAVKKAKPASAAGDWIKKGGFSNSSSLAALIKAPPAAKKKR